MPAKEELVQNLQVEAVQQAEFDLAGNLEAYTQETARLAEYAADHVGEKVYPQWWYHETTADENGIGDAINTPESNPADALSFYKLLKNRERVREQIGGIAESDPMKLASGKI